MAGQWQKAFGEDGQVFQQFAEPDVRTSRRLAQGKGSTRTSTARNAEGGATALLAAPEAPQGPDGGAYGHRREAVATPPAAFLEGVEAGVVVGAQVAGGFLAQDIPVPPVARQVASDRVSAPMLFVP